MRKFTAVPGKGIFAAEATADKEVIKDWSVDEFAEYYFNTIPPEQQNSLYEYKGNIYDSKQIVSIAEGLKAGLDVSWYADPKFDENQMHYIFLGLEQGLDVSWYADPKFDENQMWAIYCGLLAGTDASWYADPKYDENQMFQIWYGLKDGVDVSQYADPKYTAEQMEEYREQLSSELHSRDSASIRRVYSKFLSMLKESGIDTTKHHYVYEYIDPDEVSEIRSLIDYTGTPKVYKYKFTCNGDYIALSRMLERGDPARPTAEEVLDFFETYWGLTQDDIKRKEFVDGMPTTYKSMQDEVWNIDVGDGGVLPIRLTNTDTGDVLYEDTSWLEEE